MSQKLRFLFFSFVAAFPVFAGTTENFAADCNFVGNEERILNPDGTLREDLGFPPIGALIIVSGTSYLDCPNAKVNSSAAYQAELNGLILACNAQGGTLIPGVKNKPESCADWNAIGYKHTVTQALVCDCRKDVEIADTECGVFGRDEVKTRADAMVRCKADGSGALDSTLQRCTDRYDHMAVEFPRENPPRKMPTKKRCINHCTAHLNKSCQEWISTPASLTPVPTGPPPVWTPMPTPVWTPMPTPVWTPMPTPVWTPMPTPVWTPMPTPDWTPMPTPGMMGPPMPRMNNPM